MPPSLRTWLLDTLLPFWAERAADGDRGFFSELGPNGAPAVEAPKLCLVQARLLYVFSHARRLGAGDWALDAAFRALDCLRRFFVAPGGGWRAATTRDGVPLDETCDFYDQAFVLFGLAWWHRATGDPAALDEARATAGFLDRALADPGRGYFESPARPLPRRQNPHMHLLEAVHALYAASGDGAWLERASDLVRLFAMHFFDPAGGTVREFLAADLSPLDGEAGRWREPGHSMEWVWLLLHHRALTGDDGVLEPAEQLYDTAVRRGSDARGLVVEAIDADGRMRLPTALLWPQTEAVKACLARHEFLGAGLDEADRRLGTLFACFFPEDGPLWINRLSETGAPLSATVPTRVLYHVMLCIAERLRLG